MCICTLTTVGGEYVTSRKRGFRPGRIVSLVPVALLTGTNVGINPGSNGSHAARGAGGFSPGWSHQPGLKGWRQARGPLVPLVPVLDTNPD